MFYCGECQTAKGWPESEAKYYRNCGCCQKDAVCNDVPSGVLGNWAIITESLAHPETYVHREQPQRKPVAKDETITGSSELF